MINAVSFYERLVGLKSSLGSIIVLVAFYFSAFYNNIRLDGVLNLHFTQNLKHQTLITDLLVNFLCLIVVFGLALYLINHRLPRLVDLIPQLIWAQLPLIPLCFLTYLFNYHSMGALAQQSAYNQELIEMTKSPTFWLATLILIGGIILHIHFYYGLFKVDSGLKGHKLGWTFTATLLISSFLSMFILRIL